jgi:hypothetical protein
MRNGKVEEKRGKIERRRLNSEVKPAEKEVEK